jgi:D-alanyl-D-alanine carboxypeptidase
MFEIEGLQLGKRKISNYNLLIGRYAGADGMKTGFVCESGFNMIGSATRNGRTLVAIVLGEQSALSRAEAAADLLDQGFALPAGPRLISLATLKPSGDVLATHNMREEICSKKPASEQSEAAAAPKKDAPKSPYQIKLEHPHMVTVSLGGATGPVPPAMRNRVEYADVPLPTWRPDQPLPSGSKAVAAGDL